MQIIGSSTALDILWELTCDADVSGKGVNQLRHSFFRPVLPAYFTHVVQHMVNDFFKQETTNACNAK